ncbi:MAG: coproporphyrinogen-III oxidase family protein, partial [Spirulinaceae cyanobacterium]
QAFQNHLLERCGRTHTSEDIERAIAMLHQAGVTNYSIDLISGLPHQTLDDWHDSLERAIALAPPHISVYDLTIESGTAFDRWYEPGENPLPSDDATAAIYRLTRQILTNAGYAHYEVSNYAKPGYACRHNQVYWRNQSYYGFGMGAASYTQNQRFTRPRKRAEYFPWVAQGCPIETSPLSETDQLLETLMLGLRLAQGVDLTGFTAPIRQQIQMTLAPELDAGWVRVQGDRLTLADPEGFLFSNQIIARLFEQFDV